MNEDYVIRNNNQFKYDLLTTPLLVRFDTLVEFIIISRGC